MQGAHKELVIQQLELQTLPIDVQSALEHMCSDTIPQGLAWMQQHTRDCYPRPDSARAASSACASEFSAR